MNTRDVLVRDSILHDARLCAAPLAVQLFYRNILHLGDGAGRFKADADEIRDTVYRRMRDRVSKRHVDSWLQYLHRASLIRLYTGPDGEGYAEIPNYGQRDKNRRVIHPAATEESLNFHAPPAPVADPPPAPGLEPDASPPIPPPPSNSEVNRSECEAHTHTKKTSAEALAAARLRLSKKFPDINLDTEIARAEAYVRRTRGPGATLSLAFFETSWLPKAGGPSLSATAPIAKISAEPEYWREFLNEEFPTSVYSRGGEKEGTPWTDLPRHVRDLVLTPTAAGFTPAPAFSRWLQTTRRTVAA